MSFIRVGSFKTDSNHDENTLIVPAQSPEALELTDTEMDEVCGGGDGSHPRHHHIYRVIREVRIVRVYSVDRNDYGCDY
jgi:hypothetical protein